MSKLLISESPLLVLPSLATAIGLNEAIVLQQIHYWLTTKPKTHDGKPWVYNSATEWQQQFPFFSVPTIRRALNNLRERGILEVANFNQDPQDRTLWYTIDYDKVPCDQSDQMSCDQNDQMPVDHLINLITPDDQNDQMQLINLRKSYKGTETTTETNTKTNNRVEYLDPVIAAPVAVNGTQPPPTTQVLRGSISSKKPPVIVDSPYLKSAPFSQEGYIPAGKGMNPVQVYYERFSIRSDAARLTAPLEDDLIKCCPDLDKLRAVVETYSRHLSYKPGNIQLIVDWYRSGGPPPRQDVTSQGRREFGILSKESANGQPTSSSNTVSPDEAAAIREWMRDVANKRAARSLPS